MAPFPMCPRCREEYEDAEEAEVACEIGIEIPVELALQLEPPSEHRLCTLVEPHGHVHPSHGLEETGLDGGLV